MGFSEQASSFLSKPLSSDSTHLLLVESLVPYVGILQAEALIGKLCAHFGGIGRLFSISIEELQRAIDGPYADIVTTVINRHRQLAVELETGRNEQPLPLNSPEDVVSHCRHAFDATNFDGSAILGLDSAFHPVGGVKSPNIVSHGEVSLPRDVLQFLSQENIEHLVVVFNSSEEMPTPTIDMILCVNELRRVFEVLPVNMIDVIMLSSFRHFSFREAGLLDA